MLLFSAVGSKVVTFLPLYWRRNKRESGTNALHVDAKKRIKYYCKAIHPVFSK